MLARMEENVNKLSSMMDVYEELANKRIRAEPELEAAKAEMKILKENILSLILDTKKGLRKVEARMKP